MSWRGCPGVLDAAHVSLVLIALTLDYMKSNSQFIWARTSSEIACRREAAPPAVACNLPRRGHPLQRRILPWL